MMRRSLSTCALLAVVLVSVVGCVRPGGPGDMKRELSSHAGVHLKREMGVTVTRSGVWLARKIMKWSGEDDIPDLKGLRRVEVGIYTVADLRRGVEAARPLGSGLFEDWMPLVTMQDEGESVMVLTRENHKGHIKQMLVVVAESEEWVIVRMRGNLDRIIESAIEYALDEAGRPELYEKTIESRDDVESA